jgi:hypothetical protein
MTDEQQTLKRPALAALGALVLLLLGAVVFFKERVLFGDASFILFNIIEYKRFYIQEHRFGSFITQLVPVLGQKLHVPMRALLIGYSMSFNLFYLAVASFLVFGLRRYMFAILMSLYYFLFVTDSYFWTNNELHQAVAWMFLFFGAASYLNTDKSNSFGLVFVCLVLAFLTVYTHFVVVIPTLFLWIYFMIGNIRWRFSNTIALLLSVLLVVIIATKYMLSATQSYDGKVLHDATHFSIKDIIHSVDTPVIRMFVKRCFTIYWPALIVFALGIYSLIKTKQKKLLYWSLLSIAGYFLIMGLTYGKEDGSIALFHIESEWAPIGILMATPFVCSFLPGLKTNQMLVLLCLIFSIRIGYIAASVAKFKWRNDIKKEVFAKMKRKGITKLAIYNNSTIQKKLVLDWAIPEESILESAMYREQPQLTFRFVNPDDTALLRGIKAPSSISISFDMLVPKNLNFDYFEIDTTRPYVVMTYDELFK